MTATATEYLAGIVQEALQRTPEETALRMMTAHREGRTICLMITQKDQGENSTISCEWVVLPPDEITPSAPAA
jgi:ATP-dependent Clp protease adapter protein ClpS